MLDGIDKKILGLLQKNGRMGLNDIAKKVGLKSPSVLARIKKIEKEGIIKGYTVLIGHKKIGLDITAFIGVYMEHPGSIRNFEREVKKIGDEILECHHITGEYTFLLKVMTKDTDTLRHLIERIRNIKGVTRTHTMISFMSMKDRSDLSLKFI